MSARKGSENYQHESCDTCDICDGNVETEDTTTDARIFLSALARTGERFGIGHIVDVVAGANTKRIRRFAHDRLKIYGKARDITPSTVMSHLNRIISEGTPIDIDRFVAPDTRRKIVEIFKQTGFEKLTPVVEAFDEAVTFDEVRLVHSWLALEAE
ncbi:MAG: RQC domain-containing protein [Lentisphaeria bacterium]